MPSRRWPAPLLALAFALGPALPAAADGDIARARELLKAYRIKDRREGIQILVAADSARAVQPLEDAIHASVKEMDKLAKELDKADLRYEKALGYWELAETSGDRKFYDLAKEYLELVKKEWTATAYRMALLLEIAMGAGEAFSKMKSESAIKAIDTGARTETNPLVRKWYIDGLSPSLGRLGGLPTLLKLAKAPDPLTRSMAMRSLRPAAMDRRVFDAAVAAVQDKAWQVRVAAYEIIARAPLDEAAPRLVKAAQQESGDVAGVVNDLLHSLIGRNHAQDPRQWGPFWEEHGAEILEGTWAPPEDEGGRGTTVETFFTIPIQSTNVSFCLDYSASMHEEFDNDDPRNQEIRAKWKLPATRLGVAQAETIRAIRGLPATARMNVVVFSDKAKRYAARPVVASEANKSAVISWLLAEKTGWLTNIYEGLRTSFDDYLSPGAPAQRFMDLPDTVVFLTDGTPTRGRFQVDDAIVSLVSLWNDPVGLSIHAVGIGEEHAAKLLGAIAERTKGSYFDVASRKPTARSRRAYVLESERQPPMQLTLSRGKELVEGGGSAEERAEALMSLCALADWSDVAMELCAERLGDFEPDVRRAAVTGLSALAPDYVPSLVKRLESHLLRGLDASDDGCEASLALIEALGGPAASAAELVLRLVGSEASPHRVAAAKALGAIGPSAGKVCVATLVSLRALPTTDAELKAAIDAALNRIRR